MIPDPIEVRWNPVDQCWDDANLEPESIATPEVVK